MLELLELRFGGIGRFVKEQSINFASLDDFIQIDGLNKNTGGSSGAAKTTVFNALDVLLGLNDLPITILQSRYSDEPMSLHGDFSWDGKKVSITRGKKLKVTINDKVFEGSNALAEEQIDLILGMPRKIFRKLLHKRQKEGGFFLEFTPQKMHEFLIDCLDLVKYRKDYEKEEKKIKDFLERRTVKETELFGQEAALTATKEAAQSLGPVPNKNMSQDTVISLKKKMEEAENELKSVLAVHNLNISQLERERPELSVVPFDRSLLEFHKKTIDELNSKISVILQEEKDRQAKVRECTSINDMAIKENNVLQAAQKKAHEESIKLAEEIKKLKASICPTCEQTWATEVATNQISNRVAKLLELKKIMDRGTQALQDRLVLDKNVEINKENLKPKIDPRLPDINEALRETHTKHLEEKQKEDAWIAKQNAANKIESEKFAHKQKALLEFQTAEANQARGQLDLSRRLFDNAVSAMRSAADLLASYEKNLADLKSKEEKFTNKIAEIKSSISAIDADIALAEEACKAVKTFLSYSFEDALEAISQRSTEIIRCIPNMSNATIQFDGTRETKDGNVKEEVNAVIGMDGEEKIPIRSLSGGERSAVDIAVDLAVIDFIETKSNKGINIFILDEPFTGLGPVEIEPSLEVLKNSNTNKKIVIVDHNSEVKQMVQNRLVVVREGLTSRIEKDANV